MRRRFALQTSEWPWAGVEPSLGYVLAVHVPIAGMGLVPLLLGWPLLFTPVHIVFLELVIDPACSVAFEMEPDDEGAMKRPPRAKDARLLGWRELLRSVIEGALVFGAILLVFRAGLHRHAGPADARALGFATLIVCNLILILMSRSRSRGVWKTLRAPNLAWWLIVAGALGLLAVTIYVPPVRTLFKFSFLHLEDLALCLTAGVGVFIALLAVRWLPLGPQRVKG